MTHSIDNGGALEISFLDGHFFSSYIHQPSFLLIEDENMAYLRSVDLCVGVVNSVLEIRSPQLL
ncbi:hypothetical protein T12_7990 [Trichinella patagoniensis]|uniref:Uncharacterized protein n=1 Tax=Trichinella patagoniensis TaxID=990121 RepID=A0A0V0Z0A9_9BILA|nr:hypothetical protein T12_7990 [Trichinella patagoniensis]